MQVAVSAPQAPPVRSLSQCMTALGKANQVREYRAQIKRELKARRVGLYDVLDDPMCATMKVREVLLAVPHLGGVKVDRMLRRADIAHAKTCAGITLAQRQRLARELECGAWSAHVLLRSDTEGTMSS